MCSWSLQPKSPEELIEHLLQIGLKTVQIALDPIRDNPEVWGKTKELCAQHGIILVSGMFGTIGEDYTTMETIKRTGAKVIIMEPWYDRKMADMVAQRTGARVLVLPVSVGGMKNLQDYISLLGYQITQLAGLAK